MLRNILTIPKAACWLGFAGLIPFFSAAFIGLVWSTPLHEISLKALLAYGAVILSFLGGIRWGLAIATSKSSGLLGPLAMSVAPALVGWVALLVPSSVGLVLLALGFAVMLMADFRLSTAPYRYTTLRLPLSIGAIVCLLIGLII